MTPHHKFKLPLTRVTRLTKGNFSNFNYVPDTAADLAIKGQHLGFEVSVAALMRLRGFS